MAEVQERGQVVTQIVGRIEHHGYVNHIGERVVAGIRGA